MAAAFRSLVVVLALWLMPASTAFAQDGELAIGGRLASDYVAIRQRPLFSPDRLPPAIVQPEPFIEEEIAPVALPDPPPEPSAPPSWELVGLVRSERLNSATFRRTGSPLSFNMRKGETVEGWTLSEIGRFEVFIENGEGRARIGFPGP